MVFIMHVCRAFHVIPYIATSCSTLVIGTLLYHIIPYYAMRFCLTLVLCYVLCIMFNYIRADYSTLSYALCITARHYPSCYV